MNITWKQIPNFEGFSASSEGEINGPKGLLTKTPVSSKVPYLRVRMRGARLLVHRCVMAAFSGQWDSREVNHRDGDKQNNRSLNLEWSSHRRNVQHAYAAGLNRAVSAASSTAWAEMHANGQINYAKGERHGSAKLTEADVRYIRSSLETNSVLAKRFNVKRESIRDIRNYRIWKHLK